MGIDIDGKVALVTGANRGIGKTIVETFIKNGAAKVYAGMRNLDAAGDLIKAHGDKVVAIRIDLSDEATISTAAQAARDVTIVVNNGGILRGAAPLDDNAVDALQSEIDVNVYGLLRMARAFAPVLKANGGGAFVQLNSVASLKCFTDFTTYCASKAAAYNVTQGLRDALGAQGTAVLSVHPGPIATDMADDAGFRDTAEPPSVVAEGIVRALRDGDFHLFPDTFARQMGEAYRSFAAAFIEEAVAEA